MYVKIIASLRWDVFWDTVYVKCKFASFSPTHVNIAVADDVPDAEISVEIGNITSIKSGIFVNDGWW